MTEWIFGHSPAACSAPLSFGVENLNARRVCLQVGRNRQGSTSTPGRERKPDKPGPYQQQGGRLRHRIATRFLPLTIGLLGARRFRNILREGRILIADNA